MAVLIASLKSIPAAAQAHEGIFLPFAQAQRATGLIASDGKQTCREVTGLAAGL